MNELKVFAWLQQALFTGLLLFAVVFSSSCSVSDYPPYDSPPSAFRKHYVELSASPNRLIIDSVIRIRMTAFPLFPCKGKVRLSGNANESEDGTWSMVSPFNLPVLHDSDFIRYDTSFTANQEFVMEWQVKLLTTRRYQFRGSIQLDSIFVADSGRYIPLRARRGGTYFQDVYGCPDPGLILES